MAILRAITSLLVKLRFLGYWGLFPLGLPLATLSFGMSTNSYSYNLLILIFAMRLLYVYQKLMPCAATYPHHGMHEFH